MTLQGTLVHTFFSFFKGYVGETKCPGYPVESGQVKLYQIPQKVSNSGFHIYLK